MSSMHSIFPVKYYAINIAKDLVCKCSQNDLADSIVSISFLFVYI